MLPFFRPFITCLFLSTFFLSELQAQDFQQNFSSSSTLATYIGATANNFDNISTSGGSLTWSITGNKLRAVRTGNAGAATRTTNLSGIESANTAMVRAKFQVVASSGAQTSAGFFYIGKGFSTANSAPANTDVHARFAFNFTATSGQVVFRNTEAGANGSTYSGQQSLLFVTNNSGVSKTYLAPDGTVETVANDKWDLWVGTTREFNEGTVTDALASNSLSDFKILFNQGSGTIEVDDILIDPIPDAPTATAATSVGSASFIANWGPVSGATGYRLDVSLSNTFSSFVSGYNNLAVAGTSQSVSGLSASTQYYYRVRTERAYTLATNTSGQSNTISATTTAGGGPSVGISSSSPAASNHSPSATNVVLTRLDLSVTVANATLNGLTITTAGTYSAADLVNLKVRYSSDNVLDAGDATLSLKTTALGPGTQVFPSFTNQTINSGTTGYLFITADLASSFSTGSATFNIDPTAFSNISFVSGSKTGTDPVAAGNIRTLIKPEPSAGPTGFGCGTTTTANIPLSWTDASSGTLPDGYLIRWSTTSFAAIPDPTDGTAISNGASAQNVTQGTGNYLVTGLSSGTTYYFKIYAYTNTGTNIDYRLTLVPQTSCATQSAPWEDFETGSNITSYGGSGTFKAGNWILTDALATTADANDYKNGARSVRIRATGYLTMNFDLTSGLGTVTLLHGMYGSDANGTWRLEASTDGGSSWTAFTSPTYTATSSSFASQSISVNLSGTVRFRIAKLTTSGTSNRLNIDDIYVTNYQSINTGAISGAPFCAGSSGISVPFTYAPTASFPSGTTTFTAQLSDASGFFSSPVSLQSVLSDGSGNQSISVTIPSGTANGNAYQIRVVSSSPAVNGTANGAALVINRASASIAPTGTQNIFTGTNGSNLTVTEGYTPSSRVWKYGTTSGIYTTNTGITTASYTPNFALAGTYFVVCETTFGSPCSQVVVSNEIQINVTVAVPEIQLQQPAGTNQVCGFNYDYSSRLVGSQTDFTFRIQNLGTGPLSGVLATLSGLDASEFSIQTAPSTSVAAGSFSDVVIRFSPVSGGSKVAMISIASDDSDENPCTINLYGEGDASPVVPTLSNPTVSAITNNGAILGATITLDGNATILERGTVWKTSAGVTATDNPSAEGGFSVTAFNHSRASLPSGSQIFFRGYATNSAGTGLSPESNFYTLSNEPVGNGAIFTATPVSATQINLSFSAAATIPASGYLILMKSGSAVTGTPTDGIAYSVNDLVGDANVVAILTTGTSAAISGLSASTNYHFALIPFNWNGSAQATYNYYTATFKAANATTNAASLPVLGDIAIVAYATDDPDRFAFVALADIAANAQISFTDNAWSSSSSLCTNENTVVWKAPSSGLEKGSVVRIQAGTANVGSIVSGSLNSLSNSGDQIFAYTGTPASPTFIAGLSSTTFIAGCQACGVSTNASCIANGLSNGTNAISFASHADNGYYSGPTYGTVSTLRASIHNPANWTRSNTTQTWPTPWTFTIGNVSITTGTISGSPFCITNGTSASVSVPFTTGGTFETDNVFTAQLSDATGSFAIPTNIGTGSVSPISATIPAGTVSGTGYRIRVVSSDPEANGLQNSSNLTVYLNTPDVSGVSALRQNNGGLIAWTNPGGCWNQVMVVAQPVNSITAAPSGDGTAYVANSTFGAGTTFGTGGSVVYKGNLAMVSITGLTNGITYFIKVFVRYGTVWSDGVEVSVVPSPDITGDFRSRVTTGNWSNYLSWERFNGTTWVNAVSGQFPDNTTTTATIQSGHTITVDGSSDPYDVKNVIVASGGKLYANLTTSNRYLNVYGDITCNGTIGNGTTFDGISFNIEGTKVTISGTGTFDASRIRKSTNSPNATSDLIIAMNVNLRWNTSSGTTIYNNKSASTFNVTVNENSTLSCILSTGGTSGNAAIDGVDGATGVTDRRGGTYTINGTMNIPGTLYATTDNDATGGYFCKWVIGPTGVINARQLDCAASGAAGHIFEIKQGGRLNLNNNNDNTVNPVVNFSTTNNTFNFATGSIIEYSSASTVGTQKIFVNPGFPYKDLVLSNVSTKQLQAAGTLSVAGDLRITGGVLDIQSNNIDLKGNWENYNQSGFTEGNQKVTFSGTGLQTVTCVGGEQFYNVDISNSSVAGVRLDADVTLANDLDLGTNGNLSFGPTPTTLTLSKMTANANTLKGSGTAKIDMSAAAHFLIIGCPDPGYSGTLNAGSSATIVYNRDENVAGSSDDQNLLTGFSYADILLTGKGNKVISDNLTVNGNFSAETPELVIMAPVSGKVLSLGGNFTLTSGATMNDNCRDNLDLITSGNAAQIINTNTKNLKVYNLKSTKSAGGITLNGDAPGQTTVNLKYDFAINYTGTALFADGGNTINVGDDAELGSAISTSSNFNFTGTIQFDGIGASTDIHLSDFAATGVCKAQLNNVVVRAGENATTDQLEVYPTSGGQAITVKGNLEIIQGANSSELDLNGNTLNLQGNWTSYDENAFNEGTSSTVVFNGTSVQTITVPAKEKFANLTWDNSNNLVMTSDLEIGNTITLDQGFIQTESFKIILGSTALISESEASHVVGRVQTTRTLSTGVPYTFGGLGLEIQANGAAPGNTVVNRYTGITVTGTGNQGIKRKFSIVPATNAGLNADMVFHYFDAEINGLDENFFHLYRSTDGGISWYDQLSTANPAGNQVQKTGIEAFSEWTIGDINTPLVVSLLQFTGKPYASNAVLTWTTLNEKENQGFSLFRSTDGRNFEKIGFVKGAGNSSGPIEYSFTDTRFDRGYYYRLGSLDLLGELQYSQTIFLRHPENPIFSILISPNPMDGDVDLMPVGEWNEEDVFEMEIIGTDGKLIYANHANLDLLEQLLNQKKRQLGAGIYYLNIWNAAYKSSHRMIVR